MKYLFLLVLCLPIFANECSNNDTDECGHQYSRRYGKAISRLQDIRIKTDASLDAMIRVAVVNMKAQQNLSAMDAEMIEYAWNNEYKGMLLDESRDIGHIYLSKFLEDSYDKIEKALGVEVCKALHLSDIKTVNCALAVIFNPCKYDMTGVLESRKQDYRDHFAKGQVYYGLVPVVTWWAISIGCWSGTAGIASFVCSIAASGAEYLMGNVLAPPLSDRIFNAMCPGG